MNIYGIVLSAGKGTRMKSEKPKVVHPVLFEPMVQMINNEITKIIDKDNLLFILGYKSDEVKKAFAEDINFVIQEEQLGTGHAVQQCKEFFANKKGYVFIISGDTPLFTAESLQKLLDRAQSDESDFVVVSAEEENPFGYGRIVVNNAGIVEKIVEQKDCNPEEDKIKLINSGIYLINVEKLFNHIDELSNNNSQQEYYLTDMLEIFTKNNYKVSNFTIDDADEIIGVNDLVALQKVNQIAKEKRNKELLIDGVWMENTNTVYVCKNSTIEPGVHLSGNVKVINSHIKSGTFIENSSIQNCNIGEGCNILNAYLTDTKIGNNNRLGPFIHMRGGNVIGDNNRLGNFIEVKSTQIESNTNAAHLSYLGDAQIGSEVNVGCMTVTVNYDGINKSQTVIENNSFIGCNTSLIAPIKVGDHTIIGAGSTITKDVPSGSMAIARVKDQKIYNDYGTKFHNKIKEHKNGK